jgi:uncharacterized membrane protein YeaQ/YmgE (transglycosylase-associated protein family)
MGILIWLIVGGVVGWLASIIMRRDAQQGILLNIVVGIVGAVLGGWLISPLVGVGTINDGFSVGSFVVSLLGAIILLAIVNLFRRGTAR